MEHLEFRFASFGEPAPVNPDETLVGVVGSGNLEVMIERPDLGGDCLAVVDTSIQGYSTVWRQVLQDFFERHRLSNVQVSINDGGATPAVVTLRLDQALAELKKRSA
jgi:malonate decarboxylase delta subunit